jgi:BlaI family transcriptional regulator, penicillinase repressor
MAYVPKFDERDLEILQVLWKDGPLKPSDLQKQLSFQMKNPALRWLLNDLVERGQLHRRKEGKAFFYGAAVERRPLLRALGQKLRDLLFGGSAMAMIGELAELQKLSPDDLDHLKKIARKRGHAKKTERKP